MQIMQCDSLARLAGFSYSVGNWITPTGDLIQGTHPDTDHVETLTLHLDCSEIGDNQIRWTNNMVNNGFIRLVFRHDVMAQVSCLKKEELWSEKPNLKTLMQILQKLEDVEVHVFSKTFYIVSSAASIVNRDLERMEIREKDADIQSEHSGQPPKSFQEV